MDIGIINTVISNSNYNFRENNNFNNKDVDSVKKFEGAVKAYEDEYYTGLTEEEKKKIQEKIAKYLEANNGNTDGLEDYVASLLKQYGFKGDIDEMAKQMTSSSIADSYQEKNISNTQNKSESTNSISTEDVLQKEIDMITNSFEKEKYNYRSQLLKYRLLEKQNNDNKENIIMF